MCLFAHLQILKNLTGNVIFETLTFDDMLRKIILQNLSLNLYHNLFHLQMQHKFSHCIRNPKSGGDILKKTRAHTILSQ